MSSANLVKTISVRPPNENASVGPNGQLFTLFVDNATVSLKEYGNVLVPTVNSILETGFQQFASTLLLIATVQNDSL